MAKKKQKKGFDEWDELLDEGTRTDVVQHMPQSRLRKAIKPYMWVAVIGFLPLLVISLFTLSNMTASVQELQNEVATQQVRASSQGRAVATKAVEEWLAQERSPMPGGRIVSWDGSRAVPLTQRFNDNNQDVTEPSQFETEINTFTLIDEHKRLWDVSVLVKIDPRGGAVVEGYPSIMPKVPSADDGWNDGSPWPGIRADSTVLSDQVNTAVETWAQAYTSGSTSRLTLAVGDPDNTHVYVPLNGVSEVHTSIVTAAPMVFLQPDVVIAQVSLDIVWEGQTKDTSDNNTQFTMMDVLIERADTASPIVVAWGEPGSGPTLERYQNAISGRPVAAPPSVSPAPTETPTTEPTSEPTTEPTSEPTTEPTSEPTTEPTADPTTETVEPEPTTTETP